MSKGIVVRHKETGVQYAVSEENQDKSTERKVRDLHPGETILGYVPRQGPLEDEGDSSTDNTTKKTEAPAGDAKADK